MVHAVTLAAQMGRHLGPAGERCLGILFVDHAHQVEVKRALRNRPIVERGAVQAEQFALPPNTEVGMSQLNHGALLYNRRGQLFFSTTPAPSSAARSARSVPPAILRVPVPVALSLC